MMLFCLSFLYDPLPLPVSLLSCLSIFYLSFFIHVPFPFHILALLSYSYIFFLLYLSCFLSHIFLLSPFVFVLLFFSSVLSSFIYFLPLHLFSFLSISFHLYPPYISYLSTTTSFFYRYFPRLRKLGHYFYFPVFSTFPDYQNVNVNTKRT